MSRDMTQEKRAADTEAGFFFYLQCQPIRAFLELPSPCLFCTRWSGIFFPMPLISSLSLSPSVSYTISLVPAPCLARHICFSPGQVRETQHAFKHNLFISYLSFWKTKKCTSHSAFGVVSIIFSNQICGEGFPACFTRENATTRTLDTLEKQFHLDFDCRSVMKTLIDSSVSPHLSTLLNLHWHWM